MAARATNLGELTAFAADVRAGLTRSGQKELPSKYLYDEVGSKLFEVISLLPEYGLTRADERLLRRHAHAIAARLPAGTLVAELGSVTGAKTRWIARSRVADFRHGRGGLRLRGSVGDPGGDGGTGGTGRARRGRGAGCAGGDVRGADRAEAARPARV